jgi:surface protein
VFTVESAGDRLNNGWRGFVRAPIEESPEYTTRGILTWFRDEQSVTELGPQSPKIAYADYALRERQAMRFLLYCLLSYLFSLCHVALADSSIVTIDQLRYDLIDEGRTAHVLGEADGEDITNLFIPDRVLHGTQTYTVTRVGAAAFVTKGIRSVRLPTTLKSIDRGAFWLNSLTTVTIPDSVTSIGQYAFAENKMSSLTLGTGLTSIGEVAFGTNSLTTVTIPDSVTSIGPDAFSDNWISSLTLGTGVITISDFAFADNVVNSVTIPDSVTTIGANAFTDNALTSVTIPESLSQIGSRAFAFNQLTSVTFEGDYQKDFASNAFIYSKGNLSDLALIEACDGASGWEDKNFAGRELAVDVFTEIPVTLDPYACATPPSLPIWLLWVGAGACSPPGKVINNDNFSDAVMDWLDKGNTSQYGDITQWCTQDVTDMSNAFNGLESTAKANFNADISGWNTSRVTNMNNMFRSAAAFNQDISKWDTSRVTTMRFMFERAAVFNRNIGGWKTAAVTDMDSMFVVAGNFNQNIGGWDTSKVTNMSNMFNGAVNFNQDISSWNVSAVTTMFSMFASAEKFNQNLSEWSVAGDLDCFKFADGATDWKAEYDGSITGKTPPLSASMTAAGCNSD